MLQQFVYNKIKIGGVPVKNEKLPKTDLPRYFVTLFYQVLLY